MKDLTWRRGHVGGGLGAVVQKVASGGVVPYWLRDAPAFVAGERTRTRAQHLCE